MRVPVPGQMGDTVPLWRPLLVECTQKPAAGLCNSHSLFLGIYLWVFADCETV